MKTAKELRLEIAEYLPEFIKNRNENFAYLKNKLDGLTEFIDFPKTTKNLEFSWFEFPITLKDSIDRVDFTQYLNRQKISARLLFTGGLIKQSYFQDIEYRIVDGLIESCRRYKKNDA